MSVDHSYDVECELLAQHFLNDCEGAKPEMVAELAQRIQDAIEDYIAEKELGHGTATYPAKGT